MPASQIAHTRLRLRALAQGVSGGGLSLDPARVYLGYAPQLESAAFFATLLESGPALALGQATLEYDPQTAYGPATLKALLYAGFARNLSQDFTALDDLLAALRDAWSDPDAFAPGEAAPSRVSWSAWKTELRADPGVALVPLEIRFPDPPLSASRQVEPATPRPRRPRPRRRFQPPRPLVERLRARFWPARPACRAFARAWLLGEVPPAAPAS
jgi:hypothetical protein